MEGVRTAGPPPLARGATTGKQSSALAQLKESHGWPLKARTRSGPAARRGSLAAGLLLRCVDAAVRYPRRV